MYQRYNPNPETARVGDCTVRALCKALNKGWYEVYVNLCVYGLVYADMPSANSVWGAYLKDCGYERFIIPDTCPNCYTVEDFTREHSKGTYVLSLNGHVVAVKDGDYFDTWDSGQEIPVYYWREKQ